MTAYILKSCVQEGKGQIPDLSAH